MDGDAPSRRSDKPQSRQQLIAQEVVLEGTVRIEALAAKHNISLMTAHRDIDALAARGIVRKSRGAVTALPSSMVEASDIYRRGRNASSKQAMAHAALNWIQPGQAVILDDSTTTEQIVPLLSAKSPLTVITNYLSIVEKLTGEPDVTLIVLGGRFYPWANAFLGAMTVGLIEEIRADIAIMSSPAVIDGVAFHQMEETIATKRAMFEASEKRLLLLDHTKFDKRAFHALFALRDFDAVIVDEETSPEQIDNLRRRGATVEIARSVPVARRDTE